ncbi:hypothetical protein NL676_012726 [Syzygium grande]|nr:hypothetical protein NL676_012726 [Syzygium grande]
MAIATSLEILVAMVKSSKLKRLWREHESRMALATSLEIQWPCELVYRLRRLKLVSLLGVDRGLCGLKLELWLREEDTRHKGSAPSALDMPCSFSSLSRIGRESSHDTIALSLAFLISSFVLVSWVSDIHVSPCLRL